MMKAAAGERLARRAAGRHSRPPPAIKRAGADLIITYYAKDLARWLGLSASGLSSCGAPAVRTAP